MAVPLDQAMNIVSCPHCDQETPVSVPESGVDLEVKRSVALYGDHTTVVCPTTHTFWVYFC